ncbi:GNAT family N-acetyltransferase [Mariniluteicoccus endophyticus]
MGHTLDDTTSLTWRVAQMSEIDHVTRLIDAINYFDDPAETYLPETIRDYCANDPTALTRLLLGWEADSVVAFAWNIDVPGDPDPRQVRLGGGVHPAYRHQGIGRQLLRWQWDAAVERNILEFDGRPLELLAYADARLAAKGDLYVKSGMHEKRRFVDMRCPIFDVEALHRRIAETSPEGITFVPFTWDLCGAARDAHNEAFAQEWNAAPVSADEWHAQVRRPAARPEWSWLALDDTTGEVVGYAMNSDPIPDDDVVDGWTDRLGVRPSHRGRGIARGLLVRSLATFADAGADAGGLGIDSRGELNDELYRSVGYEPTDTIVQYAADAA